jgi:phage terminase Nu1 subunit (DNA packaging protein)
MSTTNTPAVAVSIEILNSWKEIASYLNRGVRTVQRWEADLGLPVRRPRGKGRSAVIAMRSELDGWIRSCPTETAEEAKIQGTALTQLPMLQTLRASTLELHRLRDEMNRSRQQLSVVLSELAIRVEKVLGSSSGVLPTRFAFAASPTTNDQRPTTNDQRPTTNDQRPTTNDQRPTINESTAA